MSYLLRAVSLCLCVFVLNGVLYSQVQSPKNAQTFERTLHVAPLTPNGERYVYVPFDVPRGAVRVAVAYDYAREGGANTIDLGVFDARSDGPGREVSARGFRGWSGGRRPEFFISREEATPGYLAGELPAGRWRVILGLYKVAPAGVDVKIKISIETGGRRAGSRTAARPTTRGTEKLLPREWGGERKTAGPNLYWFAGDLHMHTVHSDGDWTVPELAAAAGREGLDFIFVTDHNTASHHADVEKANVNSQPPLVMRGEEVTTYGGHANAWGLPAGAFVDFRVRPGDAATMSEVAADAHRLGALVSVNHPFALCGGCDWSYGDAVREFDAVEVWNGEWDATDESALKLWDGLLQRGLRPTAVASSDSHRAQNPIGHPTTHVAAVELSQATLLDSIRRGRAYLTREPKGLVVDFEAAAGTLDSKEAVGARKGAGEEIRLTAPGTLVFYVRVGVTPSPVEAMSLVRPYAAVSLVSGGRVIRTWKADQLTEVFEVECERDGYYRLEVRDRDGAMLALTNPVYVRVGTAGAGRVSSRRP
ncbi:MAG: PHP domain-containing protein [Acidobacteria bacterium]|nr:PHP domain-containing protein [Acidobacteriota bacterium]